MNTLQTSPARKMLNKVPEVTLYFWVIKILATTVGETAADFLIFNFKIGLANTTYLMGALLVAVLVAQFRTCRCVEWVYWLSVVLISIVGTLITDNLVDNLGVPLQTTVWAFGGALVATFVLWYASEKTLSIHSITTSGREAFYWLAILFTFALGTAAGDLAAETMKLGYANSALMFAAMIGAVTVAYNGFRANAIAAFWMAYILTRPLGASLGDLLSQPIAYGGLGWGTVGTSGVFLAGILSLVLYLSWVQKKQRLQRADDQGAD
jgi:uncharacterized membrane-anchored protein